MFEALVEPCRLPTRAGWRFSALTVAWAAPLMLLLACLGGLARPTAPPDPFTMLTLALSLAIAPALGEELLFRVLLIGRGRRAELRMWVATALFVLWHPLQVVTFGPPWGGAFLDPWFLACVAVLGLALGRIYVVTKSIWPCWLVHWLTVLVWKTLLGGPF